MIVMLLLIYYFGLYRPFAVRRTAVQMPLLRGIRGGFFSVSEAPDVVSRVHVDLARQPYFCLETDLMPAFQLIMHSRKDVSLMQFQVNALWRIPLGAMTCVTF